MIAQLARDESLPTDVVYRTQAWQDDYPWLHLALTQIGPGARGASDGWRMRVQDELKTTLDFKVRPDGTAAVWCGMSSYDFHHYPTPKELFEGLAEAYRQEVERKRGGSNPWTMSARACLVPPECAERQPSRALPPPAEVSLIRTVGAVLLSRAEELTFSFLTVTGLTLVLSAVAVLVH